MKEDEWQSPITKFFNENEIEAMRMALNAEPGDLILFGADSVAVVNQVLSELRLELGRRLNLMDNSVFNFLWVTDFPLVEFDAERKRYAAVHHPFTAPLDEDLALLESEPLKVRSRAYDLVLNGSEIGGGSIRIHTTDMQAKMLNLLGIAEEEAEEKFGFLLRAPARRHCLRPRPPDDAAHRLQLHPRRDRLPENPEGHLPAHRRARLRRQKAAHRAAPPA